MFNLGVTTPRFSSRPANGTVNTVVVCGSGDDVIAIVTTVHARLTDDKQERMFATSGPGHFEHAALQHYEEVLAPLIAGISNHVGKGPSSFSLSISNLNITAVQSRKMQIEGFSADAAVLVACISALLGVPCRSDLVVTAHVASADGRLALVDNIPAKIRAARDSQEITSVLCADPGSDESLSRLADSEYEAIQAAISRAAGLVNVSFVHDVSDVLHAAFHEREIVTASLVNRYFLQTPSERKPNAVVEALIANLPDRFWSCLEAGWANREFSSACELLSKYIQYFFDQNSYPSGFGTRLHYLLASLPLSALDNMTFPIVRPDALLSLAKSAAPDDFEDVRRLFDAALGDRFPSRPNAVATLPDTPRALEENEDLAALLAQVDPDVVQHKITRPIEHAMATYRLDGSRLSDAQSLDALAAGWYLHLLRHTNRIISVSPEAVRDEALALAERAFGRRGGIRAAEVEARTGASHGGIRYVLEVMGRQYASEKETEYVNRAIKTHLELLSYSRRVALLRAFLERFKQFLPPEEHDRSPQEFLNKGEALVRMYMQTTGSLRDMFRSM